MKFGYWLVLGMSMVLIGCGGSADNASDDGGYTDEDEGVFDPMVGTMDRAKGVEDMGTSRKAEMDAAIETNEE